MTSWRWWGTLVVLGALAPVMACAGGGDDSTALTGDDGGSSSNPATLGDSGLGGVDSSPVAPPEDAGREAEAPDAGTLAPAPTLTSIAPSQGVVGTPGPTVVCTGAGFVARSLVQVNGVALPTSFVSATELRAALPDQSLTAVGPVHVTVGTAPPGGGGSTAVDFLVVNPAPSLTSLVPISALLGATDTPLTVKGSAFVAGATVSFAGTLLPTKVVDAQTLTTTIPASQLAAAGTFPVVVTNPTPGGGASTSIAFTVANPTVTVTSVTPATIPFGSAATPIALVGKGFVAASSISFNGASLPTTFTDATHLGATVPASALLAAGDFPVVVTNPAPGGGVSTPVAVHVTYPAPTVSSLTPTTILLGSPPPMVVVTGAGFLSGVTSIAFDGASAATTVTDGNHANATLTAAQVGAARVIQVTAVNRSPGGGTSSPLAFTVANPAPVPTGLSPSSTIVGAGDTSVTVSGNGFVSDSVVLVNGAAVATAFVGGSALTATIPASQLSAAGTLTLAVKNAAPGGGTSQGLSFVVDYPGPTLTAITPSSATVPAGDTAISVSGTGFETGITALQINGSPVATSYLAGGSLGATIPAAQVAAAGTLSVTAVNPAPGGGTSNVLYFTANDPAPVLGSVSPSAVLYGAAQQAVALVGSGFVAASQVKANGGVVASTFQDAAHLSATLPASLFSAGGDVTLTVTNPAPGGGTSAGQTITVSCDTGGADVVLSSLGAATTLTLSLGSAPSLSRMVTSNLGGPKMTCPSTADTSASEPYRAYLVANALTHAATLSAWAVCGSTDDGYLALYDKATKPTTQAALEACTGVISEGASGAGSYASPEPGTSNLCPGLTKANGGGLAIAACGRAVVVVQAWSTTSASYTPPTTLKVDLE